MGLILWERKWPYASFMKSTYETVQAVFEAVWKAGGDGHDVFDCAADGCADDVGIGLDSGITTITMSDDVSDSEIHTKKKNIWCLKKVNR